MKLYYASVSNNPVRKIFFGLLLFSIFLMNHVFASVGDDTYFYFRCNSTGWDIGEENRMVEQLSPGVLKISYEITVDWMVSSGDDCVLTETPELNAWGAWQNRYGIRFHNYLVEAPASHVVHHAAPEAAHFKVRYPELGSYTAIFDKNTQILSIYRSAEAVPGNVAWTTDGRLISDEQSDIAYSVSYSEDSKLSRVELNTGHSLWSLSGDDFFNPNLACNSDDVVIGMRYVGDTKKLVGIDAVDGWERWGQNFDGVLDATYAGLSCDRATDFILVRWGDDWRYNTAVRKIDGAILWTIDVGVQSGIVKWGNDVLILQSRDYSSGIGFLKAVSAVDGTLIWERQTHSNISVFSAEHGFYVVHSGVIEKLDVHTGDTLWALDTGYQNAWLKLDDQSMYLQSWNNVVTRIHPDSGEVLWSHDLSIYINANLYILPEGGIYLLVQNYLLRESEIIYLDSTKGSELWRYVSHQNYDSLYVEDSEFYVIERHSLVKLDSQGETRWSVPFIHTGEGHRYAGSVGRIYVANDQYVYVGYSGPGYRYAPGGIAAIDRDTGDFIWDWYPGTLAYFTGANEQFIFMTTGFSSETVALVK